MSVKATDNDLRMHVYNKKYLMAIPSLILHYCKSNIHKFKIFVFYAIVYLV